MVVVPDRSRLGWRTKSPNILHSHLPSISTSPWGGTFLSHTISNSARKKDYISESIRSIMMNTDVTRRQNSSCDSCRRSKRRCVLLDQPGSQNSKSCKYCAHLGRKCTFNFVAEHAAKEHNLAKATPLLQEPLPGNQDELETVPIHDKSNLLWTFPSP